jgi:hypothetical protein
MDRKPPRALVVPGIAILVAVLCSTTFLHATRAAGSATSSLDPEDATLEAAYRKTIKEGVSEYDAHHFEEARSLFRRAHELSPNARTFRGLGMAAFELRDYADAIHNLSAALVDERKPLTAEQRKDSQDLLARSRLFVDVYTLTLSPRDARLMIDGREPDFEPDGTLLLGLGAHSLEASAPDKVARSLTISVHGGEAKGLALELEPAATSDPGSADPATLRVATTMKPSAPTASNRAAAAWLWAGGATALLALGAGYYFSRQVGELNSCRNPAHGLRCTDESTIQAQWYGGLGATVVTGAAAVTMALVGILSWKSEPRRPAKHSALDCSIGPFGVSCGKAF